MSDFNFEKLEIGSEFDFTKNAPAVKNIKAILTWSSPDKIHPPLDADLSVFGLKIKDNNPKLYSKEYFVYYNQPETLNGSIVKTPDERAGGFEEVMIVIDKLPENLDELSFVVTLHEGDVNGQSFGLTNDIEFTIINGDTYEVLFFVDLDEQFPNNTAAHIGSFYKKNGHFTFKAFGQGYNLTLPDFVKGYM